MASRARVDRGRATQRYVAEQWFRPRGWPFAYSKGAGESGVDIENMAGLSPEVKAVPGDNTGALAQAHKNRGTGVPFVVWRPNGYGPEKAASWPVIIRLDDFTNLLHAAGYGDPPTEQGDDMDDGSDDDPWAESEICACGVNLKGIEDSGFIHIHPTIPSGTQ